MPTHATPVIVAWKKLSRRSELLSKALDAELSFFADNLPYLRATFKTLRLFLIHKPRIIIIQLPQGPLLLEALILGKLVGGRVVADVHTGFLVNTDWKGKLLNAPFVRLLSNADLVIVHNEPQLKLLPHNQRGRAMVVFDPWHVALSHEKTSPSTEGDYVVFPASFASDEPLEEVIAAMNSLDVNVTMYVTGNWKRQPIAKRCASDRVIFTGYLPDDKFNRLLAGATAIVTGTKREYTALMSAWEAVAYAKPLAVTDTATLRNLLGEYAVFYDWKKPQSITQSIRVVLNQKTNLAEREKLLQRTAKSLQELRQRLRSLGSSSSAINHAAQEVKAH